MKVSGTLQNMAEAFGVRFVNRVDDKGNKSCSFEGTVSVPVSLQSIVLCVVGSFDDRPIEHPKQSPVVRAVGGLAIRPASGRTCLPRSPSSTTIRPSTTDSGQCVGIFTLMGGDDAQEVNRYFKEDVRLNPLPPPIINDPPYGNQVSESLVANYEVTQDIEIASAMAPGAQIVVYFASTTAQGSYMMVWVELLARAIFDDVNKPSVLSISWMIPEECLVDRTQLREAFDALFLVAAAKGLTICTVSQTWCARVLDQFQRQSSRQQRVRCVSAGQLPRPRAPTRSGAAARRSRRLGDGAWQSEEVGTATRSP